ncbi:hypothetical protein B0H19DRAFT_1227213 [Mycena capillaripes]|nr:hypothetical protein B0H19DRAFT_1227213 [Mycena capillaripes]
MTSVQETVLKQLERDNSLVQHQLNAVLDPVAHLPLEIWSMVCLFPPSPSPELGSQILLCCFLISAMPGPTSRSTPDLWVAIQSSLPWDEMNASKLAYRLGFSALVITPSLSLFMENLTTKALPPSFRDADKS